MRLPRPIRLAADVMADAGRVNISLISAGVAFYGLLAIFPALTALIALWGMFADPDVVRDELETFRPMIPEDAFDILAAQVTALASGPKTTLGWATALSLGAALWATRSGVGALASGLDEAWQVPARHSLWHTITAMVLTLVLMAIALVALATVVLAPVALALLPPGPYVGPMLNALRWLVGILNVLLGIALLYRFGPNRPARGTPWITPGAVLALLLWAAVSVIFSSYLENFGAYDRVYGSLGAVIALLMWFYLSAFVVLLGALVDAARHRAAGPPPQAPSVSVEAKNIA
jgi:membrane protein